MKNTVLITLLVVMAVVFGAQFAASDGNRRENRGIDDSFKRSDSDSVDDDEKGGKDDILHRTFKPENDMAALTNDKYRDECGSCHMAYSAGLLPARSWRNLMAGLNDHFGDDAELSVETNKQLTDYLVANSADASSTRRSQKVMRSLKADETPLRITDTAYFRRQHHELAVKVVRDNPEVKSFSNCSACHQQAVAGSFREREIHIPGYGRWD